jgi:hypothetical protein
LKKEDILGSVRIAAPCKASWERMEGDDRVRHCEACKKNVYNLSGMTRSEAEALVKGSEGRLCVRFYRRPDGTMLTQNCPVGVMAIRKRMATTLACACTLFLSLYSYASNMARQKPLEPTTKAEPMSAYEQARRIEAVRVVLDRLYPPPLRATMGDVTMGAPAPITGKIALPVSVTTAPTPTKGKH